MGKDFKGDNSGLMLAFCILPLALDKLYKERVLLFILKFMSIITGVVFLVWWIMDIIMCATGRYEVNPIYYFKKREPLPEGAVPAEPKEKPKKEKAPKAPKEKKAKKGGTDETAAGVTDDAAAAETADKD